MIAVAIANHSQLIFWQKAKLQNWFRIKLSKLL